MAILICVPKRKQIYFIFLKGIRLNHVASSGRPTEVAVVEKHAQKYDGMKYSDAKRNVASKGERDRVSNPSFEETRKENKFKVSNSELVRNFTGTKTLAT